MANGSDLPEAYQDDVTDKYEPPSAKLTSWLLAGADQRSPGAVVHRIGTEPHNVASGAHTHDGSNSQYLFDPTPGIAQLPATATDAQIIQRINDILSHLASRGAGVSRG